MHLRANFSCCFHAAKEKFWARVAPTATQKAQRGTRDFQSEILARSLCPDTHEP